MNRSASALLGPFRLVRPLAILAFAACLGWASSQTFNANTYYQQCLRFEAGGDFETARQSCINALQVDPNFDNAKLALARVELALGNYINAETNLKPLRDRIPTAEPVVLLAEVALLTDRYIEAEGLLVTAESRLETHFHNALAGKINFLKGQLASQRGKFSEASSHYQQAITVDSLNVEYRLADAQLRYRLGDLKGAIAQLEGYQELSGDIRNAEVRALLGKIYWSMGELDTAAGHLETALALRGAREIDAQARDLRALALIYYGQGDLQSGALAFREASRRGNMLISFFNSTILWLLLLLVLVAIHLIGESRIPNSSTLEVVEGPRLWTVGQVYRILILSLLLSATIALVYSVVGLKNFLAILTPLQSTDVRAVFLIVFSFFLTVFTVRQVQSNGWDAVEQLLGNSRQFLLGIAVGILMLAIMLVYLAYLPSSGAMGSFYLKLSRLTPLVVLAIIFLPLTELFFRAFALPSLEDRYDRLLALFISAGLFALVLATPVPILIAFGVGLAEIFRRSNSGLTPFVAQVVFHVGLVISVSFIPWVRSLFMF
ncbi:MAG: tetratricopeptide repeat protein [Trueperaceae bacterium]|nr:MAG: tetratricopeptide repeat protein [Trueperaceae bacterium]